MNELEFIKESAQKIHNDLVESEFYFSIMFISRDDFLSVKKEKKPILDYLDYLEFSCLLIGASKFFEGLWNMHQQKDLRLRYLGMEADELSPEEDVYVVHVFFVRVFSCFPLVDLLLLPDEGLRAKKTKDHPSFEASAEFAKQLYSDVDVRGKKAIVDRLNEIDKKITPEEKSLLLGVISYAKSYQISKNIGFK